MNAFLVAAMLAGTAYVVGQKGGSRQLERGRAYVAIFELPSLAITPDQLAAVMPGGASVQPDGQRVIVTFNAPSSAQIGDIPTPLGTIKLVSVRQVADVVGMTDMYGPTWVTFSGWFRDEQGRNKWSGWTKPMVMNHRDVAGYMVHSQWRHTRAYRWDGKQWITA